MQGLYRLIVKYPRTLIVLVAAVTVFMLSQLGNLRWETDARVYMPKGHPAIEYDEKIERIFGIKDALVITIVNDEKSIYNHETLKKVKRITEKVAALPGVVANRDLDIASLSSATAFIGTDEYMGAERIMVDVPESEEDINALKMRVEEHADLFVGNLVSADGTATMIRAKLKEGADHRYQSYWQIKNILATEMGESTGWGQWGGEWEGNENQDWNADGQNKNDKDAGEGKSWGQWQSADSQTTEGQDWQDNGDQFFLAGRPVIEVTSGLHAMTDMEVMVPLLVSIMALALFVIFKTGRGVVIPLCVMMGAIVWTLGTMAALDIPLYTISTMLPVILVAVGIGDSVHLLSNYYNRALENPYREGGEIVAEVFAKLGPPLVTTSLTTGIGFLALLFAEMPPFKIFGLFTVLGIFYSWLLTLIFAGSMLTILKPKVAGYLSRKRSLRVHSEQDLITRGLVSIGQRVLSKPILMIVVLLVIVGASGMGLGKLFVNSSWLSDFKEGSEVALSTELINERFDGTIFLNIVVEGEEKDALKSPELLHKIDYLQEYAETLPFVGGSLSVVDYLKSLNKTLHAMDESYNVLPETRAEIAEALYLYSVSGQPELLDEVVDFDYRRANITVSIKTDETMHLRNLIDKIDAYANEHFSTQRVDINYAGSANNSYVWADLLIDSQAVALVFSKVAILLLAIVLFRSFVVGVAVVIPVALSTLIVGGMAGWLGIPMDVSTALAAGIAIGVGVDYAVHYVFCYMEERKSGAGHGVAVDETMRSVGRTVVFNAVVVSVGFAVLLLSQFPPHAKLGVFVVLYMMLSCIVALFVLPLVLGRSMPDSAFQKSK